MDPIFSREELLAVAQLCRFCDRLATCYNPRDKLDVRCDTHSKVGDKLIKSPYDVIRDIQDKLDIGQDRWVVEADHPKGKKYVGPFGTLADNINSVGKWNKVEHAEEWAKYFSSLLQMTCRALRLDSNGTLHEK